MTKANPFLWPELARMKFTNVQGKIYFESKDRKLDLSDSLMHTRKYRTVYMSISTASTKWFSWTEEQVQKIEEIIRYDFSFDAYRVSIQRISIPADNFPCEQDFRWKLTVRPN